MSDNKYFKEKETFTSAHNKNKITYTPYEHKNMFRKYFDLKLLKIKNKFFKKK